MRSDGGRPVRPSVAATFHILQSMCVVYVIFALSLQTEKVFNCMRCLTHGSCSIRPWTPKRDTDRSSTSAHHNRVE